MKATSGRLSTRQPEHLPAYANVFSGSAFIRPYKDTRSVCGYNSQYSAARPYEWPQVVTGHCSRATRVVCSASLTQNETTPDAPSGEQCGVTLSRAVYEIVERATEDRKVMNGPINITDTVYLLLACLQHDDCNGLMRRLEATGVCYDELEAVLTVGLAMYEEPNDCTTSGHKHGGAEDSMRHIVYSAMQHAASKGSNVVQVKDVLYCLSNNRDVVCLTSNPIYYAYNQMFGPFEADKMMDNWFDLLSSTALVTSTKELLLPPHLPSTADHSLRTAICKADITSAAAVADLLTAYTMMCWVPSVSMSTWLWELLIETSSGSSIEYHLAAPLLAGLTALPIPPTLRSSRLQIASALDKLTLGCFPPFASLGWKWVTDTLSCFARLEEAFPGTMAEFQLTHEDSTAVKMLRGQARDSLMELILGKFPAHEAYMALTYLHRLKTTSETTTTASLLHPMLGHGNAIIRAAFCSRMFTLQPWHGDASWQKRFHKHLQEDLQKASVASKLPCSVWALMLVNRTETTGEHLITTAQLMQEMYRHLGFIWPGSSAELLTARMKAVQQLKYTSGHIYMIKPQKQWLWEDVLSSLVRARNPHAMKTLLEYAKTLRLPMDVSSSSTIKPLQQALNDVELDKSNLTSYLSTLPRNVLCARITAEKQWLSCNASPDASSFAQEDISMAVVHAHIAEHSSPRSAVCPTAATAREGKEKTGHRHAQDVLILLSREKDSTKALQLALLAVKNGEVPPLKAITWLCMKFDAATIAGARISKISKHLQAAQVMLKTQNGSKGKQPNSTPVILQHWGAVVIQHLSLAIHKQLSSCVYLKAVNELTTAMITLVRLGQTDVWLGDAPWRILLLSLECPDMLGLALAKFVWCLSAAWWVDPRLQHMGIYDTQLTRLEQTLITVSENQPTVQTSLMMTAAACSFQDQLTKTSTILPPIVNQLFLATSRAAIISVAKLEPSKLEEATDTDLLYLSAMLVRMCSFSLPCEMNQNELNAGLKALLHEMERRQQTTPVTAAHAPLANLVGRQIEVLINPRAPHPVTAFLDFMPEGHVFRAEIVKYIADADRYEVRLWPKPESSEQSVHLATEDVLD